MRILVAVDLSVATHEVLLGRTDRFARRVGATVDLVYVRRRDATQEQIDHYTARLEALRSLIEPSRQGTARLVAHDAVDQGIVDAAGGYDLVVVGPREPGALERLLRGVMSVRVLRRAHCPVLIPRGERLWSDPPRVLVGVDIRGEVDDLLVERAGEWAARLGATADLVYAVAERLPTIRDPVVAERAEREWQARNADLRATLEQLREHLAPAQRGLALLRRGNPEAVLLTLAQQYDLVVVGNRGRTGIAGVLLGAVAGPVARQASCDVLTLNTADLPTTS